MLAVDLSHACAHSQRIQGAHKAVPWRLGQPEAANSICRGGQLLVWWHAEHMLDVDLDSGLEGAQPRKPGRAVRPQQCVHSGFLRARVAHPHEVALAVTHLVGREPGSTEQVVTCSGT
eukprot:COSAG01_NODE_8193_length_2882_cov_3.418972_3_plen_118_part_00